MSVPRTSLHALFCIALTAAAVVGFWSSFGHNQRLSELRQIHTSLRKQVGFLEVVDLTKVTITQVPVSDEMIPPELEDAYVWQFRMHLPAEYGPCYQSSAGLSKADAPQRVIGSQAYWSAKNPEPMEELITFALIEDDGNWIFSSSNGGSSNTCHLPDDFAIESLDDLLVEPVVKEGTTCTFDTNEAICLFRLRERQLATKQNGSVQQGLYRGAAVYVCGEKYQDAFRAWVSGDANSMKEAME